MPAEDDPLAQSRRASDAGHGDDPATAPHLDVMGDMDEVVHPTVRADDRIADGPTVNGAVRANFRPVPNDHASQMRQTRRILHAPLNDESRLPDPCSRADRDIATDKAVGKGDLGADATATPQRHTPADQGSRTNPTAVADAGAGSDHNPRANMAIHPNLGVRMDGTGGIDATKRVVGAVEG